MSRKPRVQKSGHLEFCTSRNFDLSESGARFVSSHSASLEFDNSSSRASRRQHEEHVFGSRVRVEFVDHISRCTLGRIGLRELVVSFRDTRRYDSLLNFVPVCGNLQVEFSCFVCDTILLSPFAKLPRQFVARSRHTDGACASARKTAWY